MTEDERMSRRAYLAAGVAGAASLAGCPGGSTTPTADEGQGESHGDSDDSANGSRDPSNGAGDQSDGPGGSTEGNEGTDDAPPATDPDAASARSEPAVVVDQVGYRPGDEKVAVVRAAAESFAVLDADGEEVTSGTLSETVSDGTSGDTVRYARFDDLGPGSEYVVAVDARADDSGGDGSGTSGPTRVTSEPFGVDEGVWGQTLAEVGRRFTLRRANTPLDDPVTGLDIDAGHPQDREAVLYFADEFHEEGEAIDVHGGWYDAGDYGKYVPPGAVTVAQLLLAYEENPDTFEPGQFAMPEGVSEAEREAGMPDLLAEAKFELEWLARMQRPDGAVYHKVAGTSWPGMIRPAEDTQTRYVFGLSTYGTAMTAAAMAMAARVYDEFDSEFAAQMREGSVAAFDYLVEHPDPSFRSDPGQNDGSGAYRQDDDAAERFWAAAELLKTTGEDRYDRYIEESLTDQVESSVHHAGWADAGLLGHWAYYTAEAGRSGRTETIANAFTTAADDLVDHVAGQAYNCSLRRSQYHWGSNAVALGEGLLLQLADAVESNETYRRRARDQVHYVLGRSPTGRGYVTGSGERAPRNPHSRLAASTGINVPGNVVGGPNENGGDPELDAFIANEDPAPAKAYLDVQGSYASNEPALDYAAPLVPLLAAVTPASAVTPR